MDDLMQKLQGILNDKESMEQLNQLASMFAQGDSDKQGDCNNSPQQSVGTPDDLGIDMNMVMSIGRLMQKNNEQDERRDLLLALKPLLKEETQIKVDRILMILRVISLLPILKESGILGGEFFGGK